MTGEDLDSNNWLFKVANGTLDLKTGLLLHHDPSDLITKISNVKYDKTARCPKFMAFLDYILAGNDELIEYIQNWWILPYRIHRSADPPNSLWNWK